MTLMFQQVPHVQQLGKDNNTDFYLPLWMTSYLNCRAHERLVGFGFVQDAEEAHALILRPEVGDLQPFAYPASHVHHGVASFPRCQGFIAAEQPGRNSGNNSL